MGRTIDEVLAELPEERRQKIEECAAAMMREIEAAKLNEEAFYEGCSKT